MLRPDILKFGYEKTGDTGTYAVWAKILCPDGKWYGRGWRYVDSLNDPLSLMVIIIDGLNKTWAAHQKETTHAA